MSEGLSKNISPVVRGTRMKGGEILTRLRWNAVKYFGHAKLDS